MCWALVFWNWNQRDVCPIIREFFVPGLSYQNGDSIRRCSVLRRPKALTRVSFRSALISAPLKASSRLRMCWAICQFLKSLVGRFILVISKSNSTTWFLEIICKVLHCLSVVKNVLSELIFASSEPHLSSFMCFVSPQRSKTNKPSQLYLFPCKVLRFMYSNSQQKHHMSICCPKTLSNSQHDYVLTSLFFYPLKCWAPCHMPGCCSQKSP